MDVVGPTDDGGVEAEGLALVGGEAVPQGQEAVDPEVGLGLGVGAVELDIAEGPLGPGVLLLDAGGQVGPLAADGQDAEEPFGQGEGGGGPAQLALHPAPAREGPLGDDDRLAVGVVEGMLGEPRLHQVDELAVAQGVPHAGRHLVDAGAAGVGPGGGHGQDGRHHQIDRDDVDHPFGDAGELPQQSPGVRDDDRLGHAEAPDPAGSRFGQRRLDDRGADHGDGHVRDARPTRARSPRALVKA